MQPKQNMPILGKDNNTSENFWLYKNKESILKEQDIEKKYKNLIGKSSDIGSGAKNSLSRHIPQNELFASESSLFLKKIRLSK